MERQSGEGGAPAVLKPLALTYHFGRATSTPDGSITSGITRRRPETAVKKNGAERDRANNIILDARTTPSFEDIRGVYSKEIDEADNIISEVSTTPSFGKLGRFIPKKMF